jgi:acetyl-CoA acetyltransferase
VSGTAGPEVAIAGVGTTGCLRQTEESVATLANRALVDALADAGLERADVDALFVQIGSPRGLDYDAMARSLALDVAYASQTWSHGRFLGTLLQNACMVLREGLVSCALCIGAFRNSPFDRHGTEGFPDFGEAVREARGPHSEAPRCRPGATSTPTASTASSSAPCRSRCVSGRGTTTRRRCAGR